MVIIMTFLNYTTKNYFKILKGLALFLNMEIKPPNVEQIIQPMCDKYILNFKEDICTFTYM